MTALLAAVGFSIGLLYLAPSLAMGLGEAGMITLNLRLSAIYVFFITLNGYQAGALAGFECFGVSPGSVGSAALRPWH